MSKTTSNSKEIEQSMINSYKILTGKNTFDELIDDLDGIQEIWVAHDIRKDLKDIDFDLILDYFAENDDFEKCIELKRKKTLINQNPDENKTS